MVPCAVAVLALMGATRAMSAPAPVTRGLSFALSFDAHGRSVTSGPFVLRVPSSKGFVKVTFDSVGLNGGMLDAPIRVRNDSGLDLLAVRVDLVSVTESVRPGDAAPFSRVQDVASPPPLAWDRLADGAETPTELFRGGPLTFAPDTEAVVVLGVVTGLAVAPADAKTDRLEPVSKASACPRGSGSGPCRVDAEGRVFVLEPAANEGRGRLVEKTKGGAVVRSLEFAAGERPADVALARDGRLLVRLDDGSKDGSLRAFRPF